MFIGHNPIFKEGFYKKRIIIYDSNDLCTIKLNSLTLKEMYQDIIFDVVNELNVLEMKLYELMILISRESVSYSQNRDTFNLSIKNRYSILDKINSINSLEEMKEPNQILN